MGEQMTDGETMGKHSHDSAYKATSALRGCNDQAFDSAACSQGVPAKPAQGFAPESRQVENREVPA